MGSFARLLNPSLFHFLNLEDWPSDVLVIYWKVNTLGTVCKLVGGLNELMHIMYVE